MQPGTEQSVTEQPGTEESVTEQPGTEESVTEQPGTGQPDTEQPSTEQPTTEEAGPGEILLFMHFCFFLNFGLLVYFVSFKLAFVCIMLMHWP